MSLADLTSREAVLEAMREYDELGRDAFLQKYGFDSAKRYYVEHDGRRYESKAIAGVAVGKQHNERGPLKNNEFTGGVASVGRKLTALGFKFVDAVRDKDAPSFGELLSTAMRLFAAERKTPFEKKPKLWAAMEAVKDRLLGHEPIIQRPHLHCQWSLGQGNWLKVPWIALFDDRVTLSAQKGTYIVLLVAEDLSRVYVTLNQGATELKTAHGLRGARQMLRERAAGFKKQIASLALDHVQTVGVVDLKTNHPNSKLYEDGAIGFVLHEPIATLTDEELERDLEALLPAYEAISNASDRTNGPSHTELQERDVTTSMNVILYGPPGTGKTYSTASRAVQLCDGALPEGGRHALMERYKALKSAGRIEFVTFHQSFGYEDFVEGLRPQTGTDDEDEGTANSGGFRLRPEPGIFKRISSVAEQSGSGDARATGFDLTGRKFYKMSLGRSADQSEIYRAAIDGGYIALGYGGEYDWSDPKYSTWTQIFEKWKETNPDISPNSGDVVQVYTLRGEMKRGDIVIVPDGNTKFRAIGEVTGDYEYVPEAEGFRHRRPVHWLRVFEKSLPVDLILDGRFSMMSLHRLDTDRLKLGALENLLGSEGDNQLPADKPEPYVLIIDEINRANVSKVFGELITLLEPDKRLGCENELKVTLPYSKEDFGVPANLHVIGTMNTADRSIALLDTALRRRFRFEELMPEPEKLEEASIAAGLNLVSMLTKLNERIEYLFDREHQIGHAYFMDCKTRADVDEVMRSKVIPLLAEYFYESWDKVWQVLNEPEGAEDGAFLFRRKLAAPAGSESFGQDRWRFEVRADFAPTAYDQFA